MPGSTAKSRYDRRSSRAPPSALPNRADLSRTGDTIARRSRSLGARTCASRTTAADRTSFRHRTRSAVATLPYSEDGGASWEAGAGAPWLQPALAVDPVAPDHLYMNSYDGF